MKDLINDIVGFLSTLTGIDLLLYCAVLFLILLVVCLAYIIKNTDEEEIVESSNSELDLKDVVKTLENEKEAPLASHTSYEEEQEEKAIISYDELLARNENKKNYNYDEEVIDNDELSIKKIDLTKKVEIPELPKDKEETIKENPVMFKYQEEEEFLKTLKLFLQQLD